MKKKFTETHEAQPALTEADTQDPHTTNIPDGDSDNTPSDQPEADDIGLKQPHKKKIKKAWTNKKIIILSIVGAVVLLLLGGGAYAYSIWSNPMAQFNNAQDQMTPPAATEQAAGDPADPGEPTPSPTIDPYDALLAQADTGFLKDIVNIMLIGVDHAEERTSEEWVKHGGKEAFHSDVMIVLSINQATGAVNMISLPRDTYAEIPGVKGIYKLNASIDCGGGWPTEGGFNKVCEAAEWMLGGIPVDYYYAVDMGAVKGLVDAIGGVQGFDVDVDFEMQGRAYAKGVQDMDGQAVLDYLRVRKNVEQAGDLNRINRQKKMLVAIFDKIQKNGLLANIPNLLDAFNGNLITNTTLAQTAALAAFAYNVSPDSIGMYSMGGHTQAGIFDWNFVLTDQKNRVELIKQIYGVDVPEYKDYTSSAANQRWEKMRTPVIQKKAEDVLSTVKARLDADAALQVYVEPTPQPPTTPESPPATSPPSDPSTATPPASDPAAAPTEVPTGGVANAGVLAVAFSPLSDSAWLGKGLALLGASSAHKSDVSLAPEGYRQYMPDSPQWQLYNKARSECDSLKSHNGWKAQQAANDQLKADIESLCAMFSLRVPDWKTYYWTKSNEIPVDFR